MLFYFVDFTMIKIKLKNIIETQDTKIGYYFDLFIQILIVLSLISFSLETIPELSDKAKAFLRTFETISVIIFTMEYLCRIYVSD